MSPPLAHAIVDLGASLGVRTIGEGVERPTPAAEITALLDAAPAQAA